VTEDRRPLTRADLPDEFTPETVRRLPINVLGRLARPGNGILSPEEQASFDAVVHEVMSETAGRVSRQFNRSDWAKVVREANGGRERRGGPGRSTRMDEHLRRLTSRIDEQVDVAEALAPGVDWSFAQAGEVSSPPRSTAPEAPDTTSVEDSDSNHADADAKGETVSDLEQRLTEQVELVQVMSEIADVSKRTYELEQQRDLQSTRTVFFGFVVSVAVLVAGWAPVVAADDWGERVWILCLTVATCVVAGLVYALIRTLQNRRSDNVAHDETA
jgi:hypothetical protein